MNFVWTMDENEWKRLKDVHKLRQLEVDDCFGNCYVGGVCCDFQHTMDLDAWYGFTSLFYVNEGSSYGELKDGTNYDLHYESPELPIECETFESFKKTFEKLFEEYINRHDELKCLINRKTMWNL